MGLLITWLLFILLHLSLIVTELFPYRALNETACMSLKLELICKLNDPLPDVDFHSAEMMTEKTMLGNLLTRPIVAWLRNNFMNEKRV